MRGDALFFEVSGSYGAMQIAVLKRPGLRSPQGSACPVDVADDVEDGQCR